MSRLEHSINKRAINKRGRGGQAVVLVTFALIAMAGVIGLTMDLGWSYFVKKQAQAAADAAAIGAVREAISRNLNLGAGFVCPVSPSGNTAVYCSPAAVNCSSYAANSASNLNNGCLYAASNGFTDVGRQKVTIQANDSSTLPPTVTGVVDVAYWVTVRTVQTVPQLFSAVLGNTVGVVSAIATAGVVSEVIPASFRALNQRGDCIVNPNSGNGGFAYDCGVDIDLGGGGSGSATCSGHTATLCASSGVALASNCNGTNSPGQCDGSHYAGNATGSSSVWTNIGQIFGAGQVTGAFTPTTFTSINDPAMFADPTAPHKQPPIMVPSGQLRSCGIQNGTVFGGTAANPVKLGPFQYYSYHVQSGSNVIDGNPIVLNNYVTFDPTITTCSAQAGSTIMSDSGSGAAQISPTFPTYIIYGGLHLNGNGTFNFGAGQYVLAGVNSPNNSIFDLGGGSPTVTGDSTIGTQFITTAPHTNGSPTAAGYDDPSQPGLQSQVTQFENTNLTAGGVFSTMYQGFVNFRTGNSAVVSLTGINGNNLPSAVTVLDNYSGSLLWQDRKNSAIEYNRLGSTACASCNADDGTYKYDTSNANAATLASMRSENRVTDSSPKFIYNASATMALNGTIYQPRGSWFEMHGNANISAALRIITGMIYDQGGGGVSLLPTAAPLVTYKAALIQ